MVVLTQAERYRLKYVKRDMSIALIIICIMLAVRFILGLPIMNTIIDLSIGAVVLLLVIFYILKFIV